MTSLMLIPTIIEEHNIENISRMLKSTVSQVEFIGCKEVVIVYNSDGDKKLMQDRLFQWEKHFTLTYIESKIRSTSVQRNLGLAYACNKVDYVLLLDDDLIFQEKCFEKIAQKWQEVDSNVGAIGFNIINQPTMNSCLYFLKQLFLMSSRQRGAVLRSGFHSAISPVSEDIEIQWLYSGASMWRMRVFDEFKFDEWYTGYGLGEDLDFSYAVSKKYILLASQAAKVDHLAYNTDIRDNVEMGKKQVKNRAHFVWKHRELSKVCFWWAIFGQILENVFRLIKERKKIYSDRFWGNLWGVLDVARGQAVAGK